MPSNSLLRWRGPVRADLDDIVDAHASVAGLARGRRAATAQVTQAYAVLLSSHFQRFCRDLHSEAIERVAASLAEPWARPIIKLRLTEGRKLDTGNPNPGNIGSDFNRFGFNLWSRMADLDKRTPSRKVKLERLNRWRNAIAHQDFSDTVGLDLASRTPRRGVHKVGSTWVHKALGPGPVRGPGWRKVEQRIGWTAIIGRTMLMPMLIVAILSSLSACVSVCGQNFSGTFDGDDAGTISAVAEASEAIDDPYCSLIGSYSGGAGSGVIEAWLLPSEGGTFEGEMRSADGYCQGDFVGSVYEDGGSGAWNSACEDGTSLSGSWRVY